jgi:hypothetical protein
VRLLGFANLKYVRGKWMICFRIHAVISGRFCRNLVLNAVVVRVEIAHSHDECHENGGKK